MTVPSPGLNAEEEVRAQREAALLTPAAELGIRATPEFPKVYGVVVDWPTTSNLGTAVALCDGTASVFIRSGTSIVGAGSHENVRAAARATVAAAARFYDDARPTADTGYPPAHRIRFYLLTFTGIRVLEADTDSLMAGTHPYAGLFAQVNVVFTEVRMLADEVLPDGEESLHPKREWVGPAGYMNCLLTAMSEGAASMVEFSVSEPVPDLVEMAAGNERLQAWLKAQAFDFGAIEPWRIIRRLRQWAHLTWLPFLERHAECKSINGDPVSVDDCEMIVAVFEVTVAPWDRSARIRLTKTAAVGAQTPETDGPSGGGEPPS